MRECAEPDGGDRPSSGTLGAINKTDAKAKGKAKGGGNTKAALGAPKAKKTPLCTFCQGSHWVQHCDAPNVTPQIKKEQYEKFLSSIGRGKKRN